MKFKNAAKVYEQFFQEYVLSDETVEQLHRVLLVMMDDVDALCRRHGIAYMLSGGSTLGAVRHKGFIPWDDDIDIMMYEGEMMKLYLALQAEYPNKYLAQLPYGSKGPERMMKIYLQGTELCEIGAQNTRSPHMVYLDVFPIVPMPDSEKERRKKDKKHYIASRFYSVSFDSKYPSGIILEKAKREKELKKYYGLRRRLGLVGRLFGFGMWRRICRRLENGTKKPSKHEGIPCGISYNREVFEKGFFAQTIEADFEGRKYFIPKEYDRYMKNLYGDYMQIPPPEKREHHIAIKVDFGKYGNETTVPINAMNAKKKK